MATGGAETSELDEFPVLLSPLARLEALQIQKLLRCTSLCDYDEMKKTLRYGLPNLINAKGVVQGQTCMHIAAMMGNEAMCSFLLNDCAILPDEADHSDTTPMMLAAQNGHERVVGMLLERGASVTAQDDEGRTVMFRCLCPTQRHCNIIDMLVKNGADCNAVNGDGLSVLCEAANLGYDEVVGRLLECGADPSIACGADMQTALMLAVMSGSTESVKLLCTAGADVNMNDSKGQTAGHKAAELGNFECLQILSGSGADMSVTDSEGNTALHLAVEDGDLLNVKFLIQRGCPPGAENAAGMIPKKLADEYGLKAISKEIKKAMSQSAKVSTGSKPKNFSELWQIRLFDWLHEYKGRMIDLFHSFDANRDGHLSRDEFADGLKRLGLPVTEDNIQALMTQLDKDKSGYIDYNEFTEGNKYVNKQYQLTAKDRDGKAKKGKKGKKKGKKGGKKKGATKIAFQIPIMESYGKTLDGEPPPQFVEKFRHTNDMARFPRDHLPEHPFQNDSLWYLAKPDVTYVSVFDAVRHSDIQTLRLALVKGTPVDVRDQFNKTPLMHAAATGRIDAAKVLLESGASVNAEDNFGWTPLHHACHAGQTALATWLVDNDADINKQSKNGGTPLMRAVECSKPEIVRLLLSKRPDVKLKNQNGQDVLQIAKIWADNVSLLLVQEAYGPEPEEDVDDKDKGKKGKKKGKKEKKKKEKKPKKGKGKEKERPETAEAPKKPPFVVPDQPRTMPTPEMMEAARRRRANIGRAMEASAIHPAKLFLPMSAWEITSPLRTVDVVEDKGEVRRAAGEMAVDFSAERSPFTLNILARVKVIEADG